MPKILFLDIGFDSSKGPCVLVQGPKQLRQGIIQRLEWVTR